MEKEGGILERGERREGERGGEGGGIKIRRFVGRIVRRIRCTN